MHSGWLQVLHASSTHATVPTIPRAASARSASGGRKDGVAIGTDDSLSAVIGCVSGAEFSLVAASSDAASTLILPATQHRATKSDTRQGHTMTW